MTLRAKIYLVIGLTFLFLFIFQYFIVQHYLVKYYDYYVIILFLVGTTVLLGAIGILLIEGLLISKLRRLDSNIATITKFYQGLAGRSGTGGDVISRLTDYIQGILEELQQSRADLENSHALLATAQKYASVGSWDLDLKTGRVRCSEEMYRITGLDPAHISSRYAFMANIIHPEDRQCVRKALQTALHGNEFCSIDYRAILPGGSQRTLHAEGEVKYHSDIKLFRITGVLYDATRQSILEELQFINIEKGFSILDINPNPVLIIDDGARVQYVNEAFEKMTGYLAKDVLGTTPPYPWWPADLHEKYTKELSRKIQYGGTKKIERLYKKKSGKNILIEATTRTLKKNGDVGYHFIYPSDVTEQKRFKANVQFYLSEITKAQEAERKRVALEIHDEIIQSLAALGLEIDALGREKDRLGDDFPTRLQGLRDGIEVMANRLRRFGHELHPSVIDQGLIPALENLVQEISRGTGINVQFTIYGNEQRLPVEMELSLFRIAQEALRNVVKHSGATEAIMKLRYTSKSIRLTISDNGIGFELPEQLGDLASQHKLGIIGMQERSHLLDGKFSIRSHVGRGTTVTVEAPVIK